MTDPTEMLKKSGYRPSEDEQWAGGDPSNGVLHLPDEAKAKVGDVVRLKSGGPRMTVVDLGEYKGPSYEPLLGCQWFALDHNEPQYYRFPARSLVPVEKAT